jgi:hypothetical protein
LTGPFVLDASMTLSWAFEGESTPFTVAVLKSLESVHAIVPALWPFEGIRLANPIYTVPNACDAVVGWTNQPR